MSKTVKAIRVIHITWMTIAAISPRIESVSKTETCKKRKIQEATAQCRKLTTSMVGHHRPIIRRTVQRAPRRQAITRAHTMMWVQVASTPKTKQRRALMSSPLRRARVHRRACLEKEVLRGVHKLQPKNHLPKEDRILTQTGIWARWGSIHKRS